MKIISRNPMFRTIEKDQSYGYERESSCTIHGIFGKTLLLLLLAVAGAAISIVMLNGVTDEDHLMTFVGALIGAMIVALIAGLIANFSRRLCPIFSPIYAIAEGFMLGFISLIVDIYYPGVALTAIVCTFVVTFVMGLLYFTGIVKVGHKFKTFLIVALISLILGSIILAVLAALNVPGMRDILYDVHNPIGWAIDIILVLFAALSLLIDFDYAAELADSEADKKYEWHAAHCLAVGVMYLYVRILELLIRIAAASKK